MVKERIHFLLMEALCATLVPHQAPLLRTTAMMVIDCACVNQVGNGMEQILFVAQVYIPYCIHVESIQLLFLLLQERKLC